MRKPWYQSKTKWAALVLGAAQLAKAFPVTAPYAAAVEALGIALGGFGLRDAMAPPP